MVLKLQTSRCTESFYQKHVSAEICCLQLENKNVNNSPAPFASYIARYRTLYQQSKSTTPLYYSWNLGGEYLCHFSGRSDRSLL